MAPEVHRQQPYGYAIDVFAFGRVLYRMLCALSRPRRQRSAKLLGAWMVSSISGFSPACMPSWAYEALYCRQPVGRTWPLGLATLATRCCDATPSARPTMAEALEVLEREPIPGV